MKAKEKASCGGESQVMTESDQTAKSLTYSFWTSGHKVFCRSWSSVGGSIINL